MHELKIKKQNNNVGNDTDDVCCVVLQCWERIWFPGFDDDDDDDDADDDDDDVNQGMLREWRSMRRYFE